MVQTSYLRQLRLDDMNSPERAAGIRASRQANKVAIQGSFEDKASLEKTIQGTWNQKSALAKWQAELNNDTTRRGQDIAAQGQNLTAETTRRGQDILAETSKYNTDAEKAIKMPGVQREEASAPLLLSKLTGMKPDQASEYLSLGSAGDRTRYLSQYGQQQESERMASVESDRRRKAKAAELDAADAMEAQHKAETNEWKKPGNYLSLVPIAGGFNGAYEYGKKLGPALYDWTH